MCTRGMIDQVHVVHARRAGRHAGKAGKAPVDMGDDRVVGRPVVLQHVLDEVDPPPAGCRARCRASHRSGRSPCRTRNARICAGSPPNGRPRGIGKLGQGEVGLHLPWLFLRAQNEMPRSIASDSGSKPARAADLERLSNSWATRIPRIGRSGSSSAKFSHVSEDLTDGSTVGFCQPLVRPLPEALSESILATCCQSVQECTERFGPVINDRKDAPIAGEY